MLTRSSNSGPILQTNLEMLIRVGGTFKVEIFSLRLAMTEKEITAEMGASLNNSVMNLDAAVRRSTDR